MSEIYRPTPPEAQEPKETEETQKPHSERMERSIRGEEMPRPSPIEAPERDNLVERGPEIVPGRDNPPDAPHPRSDPAMDSGNDGGAGTLQDTSSDDGSAAAAQDAGSDGEEDNG